MYSHPFISFLHLQVASLCLEGTPLSGYYIIYRCNLKYNLKMKNKLVKRKMELNIFMRIQYTPKKINCYYHIDMNVMLDFFLDIETSKLIMLSLSLFTSLIFILDLKVFLILYLRIWVVFFLLKNAYKCSKINGCSTSRWGQSIVPPHKKNPSHKTRVPIHTILTF